MQEVRREGQALDGRGHFFVYQRNVGTFETRWDGARTKVSVKNLRYRTREEMQNLELTQKSTR